MLIFAGVVVVAYLGLCAALYAMQRSFIYLPPPPSPANGLAAFELPVDGAQLRIIVREKAGHDALIYFGGNAEDVAYSLPELEAAFPDHAVYLMNYRGYGTSSGAPSERALVSDALVLFDRVHQEHGSIVVIGRSLGSGVAIQLASSRPVSRLVLVTPYDSIENLAARQFAFFPVRWLLRDKYESWKYAGSISAPTTVIAAEHDEVIPRESTQALVASFPPGIATLGVVRGAGHNTISDGQEYARLLRGSK